MALYHKYRPQTFSEVLGQDHIKTTLREQVKADNVAHAYLFSGPRGVGKTSTARILAKAVNAGVDKDGEVLSNDISESITSGNTIDIIEIDAASHTGVDNVREQIIENAQFRPTTLTKKVFIIDEVHMLSTSAFNALLKVLEEPPAYVIFILATTEPHKLPATIISRCQRFDFRPIPFDTLLPHLEKIATDVGVTVSEDVLTRIVNKSDGCGRDAVSLLDQVMSIGKSSITAEDVLMVLPVSNIDAIHAFVGALVAKDQATALASLHTEAATGAHMLQFGKDTIEYLRYLMIAKAGSDIASIAADLSPQAIEALGALTEQIGYADILALLDAAQMRVQSISRAPIPVLPLEMLTIWRCMNEAAVSAPTPKAPSAAAPTPAPEPTPAPSAPVTPVVTTPAQPPAPAPIPAAPVEASISVETKTTTPSMPAAPTPSPSGGTGSVSKRWNEIITTAGESSASLVFILKMATIVSETDDTFTLGVSYGFHKDKLESTDSATILRNAIEKVTGLTIALKVTVTGDAPAEIKAPIDPAVNDLAAAFGGKVI